MRASSRYVALGVAFALGALLVQCFMPEAPEANPATALSLYVQKHWPGFAPRLKADQTRRGKIVYARKGPPPQLLFYEITDAKEIEALEAIARDGVQRLSIPDVQLRFFEQQRVLCDPPDSRQRCERQSETLIKELRLTAPAGSAPPSKKPG